jgi:putative membrane-bound dehydrogenase-like protein
MARGFLPFALLVLLFFQTGQSAAPPDGPIPPADAPKHMTLPKGFQATLFAGEPDVVQPIAFTFDDRGRLWVAECLSYPDWSKDGKGADRIVVFDDPDGTGHFKTRKVFYDKAVNVSGIAVGFGGVWLCSTPNLVFIPIRDGDVPDGPPEVILDGWDLNAKHNVFNGLAWGPDGWLYGCNGILSQSKVGKPGTPAEQHVPINCGVWRYHPTRKVFEAVAHGTTNPWGLDFDDYGQAFITNCVIKHLFHVIPGAHFERMFGQDFNPHLYALMQSCADHIHWGGGDWTTSRGGKGEHDAPGGGHAHVGAMVYLGDNWPAEYRNGLFTCNIHGNRVNHDLLERHGSGYVAKHDKDFLLANDPWFRGLAVHVGPDGAAFVSDWTDTGECHNYEVAHKTSGRIYKITHDKITPFNDDLAKLSDAELVERQLHKNDWHVRHARRLLQERAAAGKLAKDTRPKLLKMLRENPDVTRQLRALWALHVTGGIDEELRLNLLENKEEWIRAWTIQLALEDRQPTEDVRKKLARLAADDPSPVVRLHLASGLQRLPLAQRWPIAEPLVAHGEDAKDANLPLMLWYGIEPLVAADAVRGAALIKQARIPLLREFLARRVASLADTDLPSLVKVLSQAEGEVRLDVLKGMHDALHGRRNVAMPKEWNAVSREMQNSSGEVRELTLRLGLIFGDPEALAVLRKTVADTSAATAARQSALQALVQLPDQELPPVLHSLLTDRAVRGAALRGLAAYKDDKTPRLILEHYKSFTDAEKADAVTTLASRLVYARALVEALEKGPVSRNDLDAFTVRQLLGYKDKDLSERLTKVWGTIRPPAEEKKTLIARYKKMLTPEYVKAADLSRGRSLFNRNCASCHFLFDSGAKIGPELTGGQRANLDYILENVIDPSAVVARDYQVSVVVTKSGRVVNGIVKREDDRTLVLQTPNDVVTVPKTEIEERKVSPLSLMPEGILTKLKDDEVRDLIAYLASPKQVPLPRDETPP